MTRLNVKLTDITLLNMLLELKTIILNLLVAKTDHFKLNGQKITYKLKFKGQRCIFVIKKKRKKKYLKGNRE